MVRPVNSFSDESLIGKLKPYPTMKNSNVPYVGEIPSHWDVRKFKHWLLVNQATLPEDTDPDYTFDYLDIGSVGTGRLVAPPERIRFGDSPSRARRVVRQGDTIVSTVRTYLKAVWHAGEHKRDQIASTGFAVLTPQSSTCPKFISYLCQSQPFTDRVTADSVGVAYPAIAETKLEAFKVAIPPVSEQIQIAAFLDQATGKIERYIQGKRKLIALLEEQRRAMVHKAVTGQINVCTGKPYPAYNPSGVEWQREMPLNWDRKRLKVFLRPVDRRSATGDETLLSLRRDFGVVNYAEHFARPSQSDSLVGYKIVEAGQLVVNRLQANNGLVFHSSLHGLVSPDYSVFERKAPLNLVFLSESLRTSPVRAYFRRHSTGLGTGTSGFLRLYDDKFLNTPVALPSVAEQDNIVAYIDRVTASAEGAVRRNRRQIDLLREFRTRLVADVVTGKVDVREAGARLCDEGPLGDKDGLDEVPGPVGENL